MIQKILYFPDVATAHGPALDRMTFYVHILMAVLFIGWGLYFAYALYRFRASKHPKADPVGIRSHTSQYVEVGVVIAEAVLLLGFSVPLWAARVDEFPRENPVEVRVVGQQFAWNIHYPGADGKFGKSDPKLVDSQSNPVGLDRGDPDAKDDFFTVNQLHLPVNRPAILHLSSLDVIHSFGVPEFRVKQDAIPGMESPLWFVPTVTSEEMRARKGVPEWNYEIACAQLCGLGHYRMRAYVTVDTPEQYDAWVGEQAKAVSEAGEGGGFWE
jgi:cytochrome c oxidase subunit II